MRLRYAPTALAELDELLDYLSERSPQGARRVGAAIRRAEQDLVDHPHIGQLTTARPPAVRRYLLHPFPYVLFYETSDAEVLVIAVRHAARDPASMPGQG